MTAFSISAEELLRQSPDLYALLLLQRLPQLEDLRKKANSEGESRNIFSTTSKKKCFSIALRHTLVVLEMH